MERLFSRHLHEACGCHKVSKAGEISEQKYERSRPFSITHLSLDLTLDFEEKSVAGKAKLDFARRAANAVELELDAHAFLISRVSLHEGKKERVLSRGDGYEYDGEVLSIDVGDSLERGSVTIEYSARPSVGLYFLEPDEKVPGRPKQVWSQCQDEDGHHFFPCLDKPHVKMTTEIRVTVPSGMTVLSNGKCVEKKTPKGAPWSFHYKHDEPHPAYLVTLVAGEFDEWSEEAKLSSGKVVPLRFLVPKGRVEDGKRAFAGTARMLRLLSDKFGVDYPWDSYAQIVVSDFIFGGMENTTATTMYEHILLDEKATIDIESHDLVVHELGHQWFGDFVTCRDWSHAWLNEGFATYCELVEKEDRLGRDEYDFAVMGDLDAYLGEANSDYMRPIVSRKYDEPIDLFDRHLYQKGGLVLHMLRRKIGDPHFFRGISKYLTRHARSIVETNDLVRALEEETGHSLERFFDEWVYRAGHPELFVKVGREKDGLTIDFKQTYHGPDPHHFELELEVALADDDGEKLAKFTLSEAQGALTVKTKGVVRWLVVDPEFRVTAPLKVDAPLDIVRGTLEKAKTARGRAQAAAALGKKHDPLTQDALAKTLGNEKESYIVRSEAAHSISRTPSKAAEKSLIGSLATKEARVRRASARALGEFRGEEPFEALRKLAVGDPSYLVRAEAARSLGKLRSNAAAPTLSELLGVPSWADVITSGALEGLSLENAVPADVERVLLEWSSYGKPLRARRAAIAALGRIGEGQKARTHLVELLRDRDPHLRTQVLSALESLGDPKARGAIATLVEKELDGRVAKKARKVLASLGAEKNAGIREAGEQVQLLKKELALLKLRLERLETPSPKTIVKSGGREKAKAPKVAEKTTKAPAKTSSKKTKKR